MYNTSIKQDNHLAVDLLNWYQQHQRRLPWRETRDPYRIWLAETMLQQTQVDMVIPYYNQWLKKFPTLKSVAQASIDDLLKCWEGLGYYRCCHNFHQAVKKVVAHYRGAVPDHWKTFNSLPGVGDYTTSAVLSIAYNRRVIRKKLQQWIDQDRPGDFNQALMDLGNLVCRPNQAHCPLKKYCQVQASSTPEDFPHAVRRKPLPHHQVVAGIIWRGDRFLIQRRPDKGLLGDLWEFPGGKRRAGETNQAALIREIHEECQAGIKVVKEIGSAHHTYTHFRINFTLFHCRLRNSFEVPLGPSRHWITPADIPRYAFPRVNHKLFSLLDQQGWYV